MALFMAHLASGRSRCNDFSSFQAQRVRTAGVIPSAPLGLNCTRNLVRTRSSHLRDSSSPSAPRNDNLTEFFSAPSKVTAATAAKPAAGASAAAEARSAGATRRGRQDRPGTRGHLVHVVDEAHGVKVRTVGAAVPLGRLPIDVLERARPFFLHSQGHSKRQEFLEHLRRLDGARRSEEHTSELQSPCNLVCRLLLEKKNTYQSRMRRT